MFTHYFKVGLGILAVIAVTVAGYRSLRGTEYNEKNSYTLHVVFDNVQGLSAGNDVWLSGVVIGSVDSINLTKDGRAVVTLRIKREFKVLRGSRFSVNAGFLQDKNLSIEKPAEIPVPPVYYRPGETIAKTESPSSVTDIMSEAQTALSQINDILSEVKGMISDDQMQMNIYQTTENIEMATNEAYRFARMLRETGVSSKEDIEATIENVRLLTEKLNETAKKVDVLIANANDIMGDTQTKQQIKDIVDSLNRSMDNIEKTTDAIKGMATDKELETDIRETIKSTRKTMQNADKGIGSFTRMIEAINDTEFRPDFEFRYETREDVYHADMNVRIFPPNSDVFYLFGYDNLGQNKETNLMFGVHGEKPAMWYKFGLKDSKLAVGFEYDKDQIFYYGFLSDPNDLEFSLRLGKELNKNLFVIAGLEGVLKRDSLSIGLLQRY